MAMDKNEPTLRQSLPSITQLPPELKQQIYSYVVGGNLFHIYRKQPESYARRVLILESGHIDREYVPSLISYNNTYVICEKEYWDQAVSTTPERDIIQHKRYMIGRWKRLHLLDILQACSTDYATSRKLLCSINTFGFADPDVMKDFYMRLPKMESGASVHLGGLRIDMEIRSREVLDAWHQSMLACVEQTPSLLNICIDVYWHEIDYDDYYRILTDTVNKLKGLPLVSVEIDCIKRQQESGKSRSLRRENDRMRTWAHKMTAYLPLPLVT